MPSVNGCALPAACLPFQQAVPAYKVYKLQEGRYEISARVGVMVGFEEVVDLVDGIRRGRPQAGRDHAER